MSFILYGGVAILATSVVTSVATKAVTSAPSAVVSVLNRAGISDYFGSTAKSSYKDYYKFMVSEGPLYNAVLSILSKNADKSYGQRQDPRAISDKSFLSQLSGPTGPPVESWIAADTLCFRNSTTFYDYSAYGRARVRFYYDASSNPGQAIVMCKKKSELEEFRKLLISPGFDASTKLVFIGVG